MWDCTDPTAPCSLDTALRTAQPGDTISLADGSYDLGKLTLPAMPLNWRPTDPNTRPLLMSWGPSRRSTLSGQSGSAFEHLKMTMRPPALSRRRTR